MLPPKKLSRLPSFTTMPDRPVNVASVKPLSPFRYPGGKTWLVPTVCSLVASLPTKPELFIEPFAGGASIGLAIAFERLASKVLLAEIDAGVSAVWETIINLGRGSWLGKEIENFDLTPQNIDSLLDSACPTTELRALQTIVRNRINHGGILANGAGRMKNGENRKGLASRWYPETLKNRILAIDSMRDRLVFTKRDALEVIRNHGADPCFFFIDPPYTAGSGARPGRRLYTHSEIDHAALFALASTVTGIVIMTYNDSSEIRALAQKYRLSVYHVPMKTNHHAQKQELIISNIHI